MSAVLASQIIRTELLLQRYQIRRQLEQQRYRSNKLSQPLQSQQRSNQEPQPGPATIGSRLRAIQERGSSEPVRPPPGAMRILGSKHRVSRVCRRSVARCAPVIQRGKDSQQRTGSIRATWPRVDLTYCCCHGDLRGRGSQIAACRHAAAAPALSISRSQPVSYAAGSA